MGCQASKSNSKNQLASPSTKYGAQNSQNANIDKQNATVLAGGVAITQEVFKPQAHVFSVENSEISGSSISISLQQHYKNEKNVSRFQISEFESNKTKKVITNSQPLEPNSALIQKDPSTPINQKTIPMTTRTQSKTQQANKDYRIDIIVEGLEENVFDEVEEQCKSPQESRIRQASVIAENLNIIYPISIQN